MKKKIRILFIVLFALIILAVPCMHLKEALKETNTSLDLVFNDSFLAFYEHGQKGQKYLMELDSIWKLASQDQKLDEDEFTELKDEIGFKVSKLKRFNSYLQLDSENVELLVFKELKQSLFLHKKGELSFVDLKNRFQFKKGLDFYSLNFSANTWWRFINLMNQGGFLNAGYLKYFETQLEKNSPAANQARNWTQWTEFRLFNKVGNKALLGKENWLFYREDVDFVVNPGPFDKRFREEGLDNPLLEIVNFNQQLKSKNIDLWVVIIPTKASIYPERLTGDRREGSAPKFRSTPLLDSLNHLGINVVALHRKMWDEKISKPEQALFLKGDTHWSPQGAEWAAKQIAESIKEKYAKELNSWDRHHYCINEVEVSRKGDIVEMTGLQNLKPDFLKVKFPEEIVRAHPVFECDSNGVFVKSYHNDLRSAKVMILGDSYSRIYQTDEPLNAGWIAHFSYQTGLPTASIVSDGGASTLVREKLARKPKLLRNRKILLWEIVERDLRFGEKGWKEMVF